MANHPAEAQQRLPVHREAARLALNSFQGHLEHAWRLPDATVAINMREAELAKAGITQPELLWQVAANTITHPVAGTNRPHDKSHVITDSISRNIIPSLAGETAREVIPFIVSGQQKLLEAMASNNDANMRKKLQEMYLLISNNQALGQAWSQYLYEEAQAMTDPGATAPESIVGRAIARMEHAVYGSDGRQAFRTERGAVSPFASEIIRFVQDPMVLEMSADDRATIYTIAADTVHDALRHAKGDHVAQDLQTVIPALDHLRPHQSRAFVVSTTGREVAQQRINTPTQPVYTSDEAFLKSEEKLGDGSRQEYDLALKHYQTMWRKWAGSLSSVETGYGTPANLSNVRQVEQEIQDMQTAVSRMSEANQAAFVEASLQGSQYVLEHRTTEGARQMFERVHDVLDTGWRFLREHVWIDDPLAYVQRITAQMENPQYGASGLPQYSVQETIAHELHAFGETLGRFDAFTQQSLYNALQHLKTRIPEHRGATRNQLIRLYREVAPLVTEGTARAISDTIIVHQSDNTNVMKAIQTASQQAVALVQPVADAQETARRQQEAARQAELAVRLAPANEMWQTFVDTSANRQYGFPAREVGIYDIDRGVVEHASALLAVSGVRSALTVAYATGRNQYMAHMATTPMNGLIADFDTLVINSDNLSIGRADYLRGAAMRQDYHTGLIEAARSNVYGFGTAFEGLSVLLRGEYDLMLREASAFPSNQQLIILNSAEGAVFAVRAPEQLSTAHARLMVGVLDAAATSLSGAFEQMSTLMGDAKPEENRRRAKAYLKRYYTLMTSPVFGKGGLADASAYLRAQVNAVMEGLTTRDSDAQVAFLEEAVNGAFDLMSKTENPDIQMRLTYWVMWLAAKSPIAIALDKRETTGEGAKATKTIGQIVTKSVIRKARELTEVLPRMLPFIETRTNADVEGKSPQEKAIFVMLLGLSRFASMTHKDGAAIDAKVWESIHAATIASIENVWRNIANNDDTSWMETLMSEMMQDPLGFFTVANAVATNRLAKDERKGKDSVRLAATDALAAMGDVTPEQLMYAYYERTGTMPLEAMTQQSWSEVVLALINLADNMAGVPGLRGAAFENVLKYTGDIATVINDPSQRMTYLVHPTLADAENAHGRRVASAIMRLDYQVFHAALIDPAFNRPINYELWQAAMKKLGVKNGPALTAEEQGAVQAAKRQARVAVKLLMEGAKYATRAGTDDTMKEATRQLFFEDLTAVLLDTQGEHFNPMVRHMAVEVLRRWGDAYSQEALTDFYDILSNRIAQRGAHWILDDGHTWPSIVHATVNHADEHADRDAEAPFRVTAARVALDATLDLLSRWASLGMRDRVTRSAIASALNEELYIYDRRNGDGGIVAPVAAGRIPAPAQTLRFENGQLVPGGTVEVGLPFVLTAPLLVGEYGNQNLGQKGENSDRVRLESALSAIGTADGWMRAAGDRELRPPTDPTPYFQQVCIASNSLATAALEVTNQLRLAIQQLRSRFLVRVETDAQGRITGLPEFPALSQLLVDNSTGEIDSLLANVTVGGQENAVKELTTTLAGQAKSTSGAGLATDALERVQGGNVEFLGVFNLLADQLKTVLQAGQMLSGKGAVDGAEGEKAITAVSGQNGQGGESRGNTVVVTPAAAELMGVLSTFLTQKAQAGATGAQAVQGALGEVFKDRQTVRDLIKAILSESGDLAVAQGVNSLRIEAINMIADMIVDQRARAAAIQSARREHEVQQLETAKLGMAIETAFEKARIKMIADHQEAELKILQEELDAFTRISKAENGSLENGLVRLEEVIGVSADEFINAMMTNPVQTIEFLRRYKAFLDKVSAPGSDLVEDIDGFNSTYVPAGLTVRAEGPDPDRLIKELRGEEAATRMQGVIRLGRSLADTAGQDQ